MFLFTTTCTLILSFSDDAVYLAAQFWIWSWSPQNSFHDAAWLPPLHPLFYWAIMGNTEENWARNQLLLSSTCLTSSAWPVAPLLECNFSKLLWWPCRDYTQSKFCLLTRQFQAVPKSKLSAASASSSTAPLDLQTRGWFDMSITT